MFNTQHILYIILSGVITILLLALCRHYVRDESKKNCILKITAVVTVLIHYSNIWVEYFTTGGTVTVENNHLLPVYPCNVVMWMLLIVACIKEKKGLWFDMLAEFCFYGGTVCGVLGIVLNANFDNTPTLADYDVLKGLLSHSTMLLGCLYTRVGGYFRICVFNSVSIMAGLLCFISCGMAVDSLYIACGMEAPDGMWLRSNEYLPIPPLLLSALAPVIVFIVLSLWELRLPSEERWYHKRKVRDSHA